MSLLSGWCVYKKYKFMDDWAWYEITNIICAEFVIFVLVSVVELQCIPKHDVIYICSVLMNKSYHVHGLRLNIKC